MKLRELQEVLQQERRSREDERRTQCEERRRKEEEIHRQAMANLVQAKAAIKLMTEKNAELQEEVCAWFVSPWMEPWKVSQLFGLRVNVKQKVCICEQRHLP